MRVFLCNISIIQIMLCTFQVRSTVLEHCDQGQKGLWRKDQNEEARSDVEGSLVKQQRFSLKYFEGSVPWAKTWAGDN